MSTTYADMTSNMGGSKRGTKKPAAAGGGGSSVKARSGGAAGANNAAGGNNNNNTSMNASGAKKSNNNNNSSKLPPVSERLTRDPRDSRTNGLPDYGLLTIPRTNNYYAAVGGCPCIPRCGGRPGGYTMKSAQMRSVRNEYGAANSGCGGGCACGTHTQHRREMQQQQTESQKQRSGPAAEGSGKSGGGGRVNDDRTMKLKSMNTFLYGNYEYGWRPGPHTVRPDATAACGKCDTYGNLGFKSRHPAHQLRTYEDFSDVSSADGQKLADLEELILEEHRARVRAEADLAQLGDIQAAGTQDLYLRDAEDAETQARRAALRAQMAQASQEDLNELLREVKDISKKPLNQTNMDKLRRVIQKQEAIQKRKDYAAGKALGDNDNSNNNNNSSTAAAAPPQGATAPAIKA